MKFLPRYIYLDHSGPLPGSDEVAVEVDDQQSAVPHPARLEAQLGALHGGHSNGPERFHRKRDQIAEFPDLAPLRGWSVLLPLGPPPPEEDYHRASAHRGRRRIRQPRSVCS